MLSISQAVELGDIEQVKHIINSGIKFTKQSSPLGLAASLGNIEIVKTLVDAGCNIEWGGRLEPSPLVLATDAGDAEVVKFLIERGAKLDSKDENGFTSLMSAAALGYFDIVQLLVEAGAKVNTESKHGDFALLSAAINGHTGIYEYLLPLTSSRLVKKISQNTIYLEDGKPKAKLTEKLTELINAIYDLKLNKTCNKLTEEQRIYKLILEFNNYQSVDINGLTALHHAIDNSKILTILLNNGFANVLNVQDRNGNTALISACISNLIEAVELLLDAGADANIKNNDDYTALMNTVEFSRSNEIIQLLYNAGANLEIQDRFGNTAIAIAYAKSKTNYYQQESPKNVELLKSLGASAERFSELDFIDNAGNGRNDDVIKFIYDGVNINCIGIKGTSALIAAVSNNKLDTLNILLDNGATIDNATDCFISAVSYGYTEVVKKLIDIGIDVNTPASDNGVLALTKAIEKNNIVLVDILLKAGAKIPKKDPICGDVVKLAKIVNLEIYTLITNKTLRK